MASNLMTDAGEPIRRRRRPALSCLECRRRKIKCDQKNPCGQCTQSKKLTCIFAPSAAAGAAATNHLWRVGTAPPTPSNTSLINQSDNPLGGGSLGNPSNPFQISASSPGTFPVAEAPHFRRRPSLMRAAPGAPNTDQTIECLVDRVKKLEQMLLESTGRAPPNSGPLAAAESGAQQMRGTLSKTRLFGQSHWMTSFEQVREADWFM
jgi:Fungal Zn(2)-Cys(6) binuclear cluster domain